MVAGQVRWPGLALLRLGIRSSRTQSRSAGNAFVDILATINDQDSYRATRATPRRVLASQASAGTGPALRPLPGALTVSASLAVTMFSVAHSGAGLVIAQQRGTQKQGTTAAVPDLWTGFAPPRQRVSREPPPHRCQRDIVAFLVKNLLVKTRTGWPAGSVVQVPPQRSLAHNASVRAFWTLRSSETAYLFRSTGGRRSCPVRG